MAIKKVLGTIRRRLATEKKFRKVVVADDQQSFGNMVRLLDRGAHEYTGSSGYSQKQGHRDWLLIKGNRKRKALSVR